MSDFTVGNDVPNNASNQVSLQTGENCRNKYSSLKPFLLEVSKSAYSLNYIFFPDVREEFGISSKVKNSWDLALQLL